MLKLIGLSAIVLAGSGAGIIMSSKLSKRVKIFETILLLIEKMKTHLRYTQTPTKEMIEALSKDEPLYILEFISKCAKMLRNGDKFPIAWEKSLEDTELPLGRSEKENILDIGRNLGTSDTDGQLSMLELKEALFQRYLNEAIEKRNTKGKLYRTIGVLAGVWIAILLY